MAGSIQAGGATPSRSARKAMNPHRGIQHEVAVQTIISQGVVERRKFLNGAGKDCGAVPGAVPRPAAVSQAAFFFIKRASIQASGGSKGPAHAMGLLYNDCRIPGHGKGK